jgi:catechol 2,3-dioxygenase-like lactoylglutathione lyase family enzyme
VPISLHHAQVFYHPAEEAKARDFYTKGLGLAEIERPSTLADRDGLWFEAGQGQVHRGARFEEATPIPGWRRCYVFDPFGNKIELDEIPAKR